MSYAIVRIGGHQFRAAAGVTVKIPSIDAEPGSKVTFDEVLLLADGKDVQTGKPLLKGVKITAEVVRHGLGKKIRLFRFARRTGYRRHGGHRQGFTEIRFQDVKGG